MKCGNVVQIVKDSIQVRKRKRIGKEIEITSNIKRITLNLNYNFKESRLARKQQLTKKGLKYGTAWYFMKAPSYIANLERQLKQTKKQQLNLLTKYKKRLIFESKLISLLREFKSLLRSLNTTKSRQIVNANRLNDENNNCNHNNNSNRNENIMIDTSTGKTSENANMYNMESSIDDEEDALIKQFQVNEDISLN